MSERHLKQSLKAVEKYLRKKGLDPEKQRIEKTDGHGWKFSLAENTLFVFLNRYDNNDTIRVVSPISSIPEKKNVEFLKYCLELNNLLWGCALAIQRDAICVIAEWPIRNLDDKYIESIISRVSYGADKISPKLQAEIRGIASI